MPHFVKVPTLFDSFDAAPGSSIKARRTDHATLRERAVTWLQRASKRAWASSTAGRWAVVQARPNVRELQHVMERAVIISTGSRLTIELPSGGSSPSHEAPAVSARAVWTDAQIRQFEADTIRAALKAASGQVAGPGGAAQRLGLKPTTLALRIKALGILPS